MRMRDRDIKQLVAGDIRVLSLLPGELRDADGAAATGTHKNGEPSRGR